MPSICIVLTSHCWKIKTLLHHFAYVIFSLLEVLIVITFLIFNSWVSSHFLLSLADSL